MCDNEAITHLIRKRMHVIIASGEWQMEEWLTTYEAVRMSGYELDYIRKLVRAKKILGRKWGQSWQVNRASLEEFLKSRELQGEKRGRKPKKNKVT